jgi:hypothetical protein
MLAGHEDVGDARVGHLRLAELLARDPGRSEARAAGARSRPSGGLDVRAVCEPDPVAALPALEARLEPVEVDDRDGRVEQRHRLASRATASTSIRMPGGRPTCTVVRAG